MDFYRSSKSNQENTKKTDQIQELKDIIQKNSKMIEEMKTNLKQLSDQNQASPIELGIDDQSVVKRFKDIERQIINLESELTKNKTEKSLETHNFGRVTSAIQQGETIEPLKDPLTLLEDRFNEKLELLNQAQVTTRSQLKTLNDALDMLGTGVEELHRIIEKQRTSSDQQSQEISENQYRSLLRDLVNDVKVDQKSLFKDFNLIVDNYRTDFRREMTDTAKNLQDSHDRVLNEVIANYMPRNAGNELRQTLDVLSNEFKNELDKIRMRFENVDHYKKEQSQLKQEINSLIDRRVNERFNAVSILLATITSKTEKIILQLKSSKSHSSLPSEENVEGEKQPSPSDQNNEQF
ncbi:MAG: hypothetical protein ACW98I_00370 [Candidatus Hodarchaeales archaeon]